MLRTEINASNGPSCSSGVDKKCDCGNPLIKNGHTKYGKQRLLCRICRTSKVVSPKRNDFGDRYNSRITLLTREGLGIRSTARVLGIAPSTVIRKILDKAESISIPRIPDSLQKVQVDELHTFIQSRKREIYVIYSWSQELKQALSLTIGTRSKVNLKDVVNSLLSADIVN